jgi:hypothetical protein
MKRLLAAGLLAAGCGTALPRPAQTPDGYVPVERGDFDWRLMNADGVMIGARTFAREPEGTLDFWASVVQKDLEARRGYLLESAEPLGPGRALLFAAGGSEGGLYLVALFLQEGRIVAVEAGGPRAEVEKDLGRIKAWIPAAVVKG